MKIGITGHQRREGVDWSWVARTIGAELGKRRNITGGLSSMAAGADQIFAEQALQLGIPMCAIIPLDDYERFFSGPDLIAYRLLLRQCETVQLAGHGSAETAFFEAGKYIVAQSDLLFAVWDGKDAAGPGGTGEVVAYARNAGRSVLHFNPVGQTISEL